jgi:cell division protein FtsQ
MSDRFTARRDVVRRHRWFRIAIAVLVLVVVLAAAWAVWFSSLLAARTVQVQGLTSMKPQQVGQVADVSLDVPLARVDLTAIEARVKQMPRVEQVDVSRSWPHTVTIDVTERTAVVWTSVDGTFRGVDRFGVDFRAYDSAPKDLVEATVETTDPDQRTATLAAIARVADQIRRDDPDLTKVMRGISGSSKDSVRLQLTKGRTVTWGSAAQPARKLEVLNTLLGISASEYDVSAPDQPTTRG